jgi:putative lipoprotein
LPTAASIRRRQSRNQPEDLPVNKLLLPTLLAATFALVACNQAGQNDASKAQTTKAALATAVTGSVTLRTPTQLSGAAKLHVQLTNVTSKPPMLAGEIKDMAVGALPINFQIDFNPASIDQNAFYVVEATIIDGERHYVSPRQYPVLTKGAPAKVDIQLNPEPTAAEVVEEDYKLLSNAAGGMKRVQGSSEDENSTTAWDGFFDKKGLRYIREIVDLGDKGRINTFFGYREDGKVMMVVRETVPAMAERPNSVTRVGWNDKGELVLHVRRDGSSVPDAEAKSLHDRAASLYETVSKRKP